MAVVDLGRAEADLAIVGYEDRLAIAVSNSRRSTVLSGDPQAIQAVVSALEAQGVFCRLVKVDVASHSPQVDGLLDELRVSLAELSPQAAALPIYSTVEAALVDGSGLTADYWARNVRQPVRFAEAVEGLIAAGATHFIELSPHPLLLPAIEQGLQHAGVAGQALASLRREEPERATLLMTLGALYVAGATPDWSALVAAGTRAVPLPSYPWQHERFWHQAETVATAGHPGGHPLLGYALRPADAPGKVIWQTQLDLRRMAYLADHRVQGAALLPATGFIELALAAAAEAGLAEVELEGLRLHEALVLPEAAAVAVQVVLEPGGANGLQLRIFSAVPGAAAEGGWRLHAEVSLREPGDGWPAPGVAPAELAARLVEQEAAAHQQAMQVRGLAYGPAFRTVGPLWSGEGEVLARLVVQATGRRPPAARMTLLDGCLQLAVAVLPAATAGATFLPVGLEGLRTLSLPMTDEALWGYARLVGGQGDQYQVDLRLVDITGNVLAELRGVRLQRARHEAAADGAELDYVLRWEPAGRPAARLPQGRGSWLIFGGSEACAGLVAALAARGERLVEVGPGATYARLGAERFVLNPEAAADYGQLLAAVCAAGDPPLRGVVYSWEGLRGADAAGAAALVQAEQRCTDLLRLLQALAVAELAPTPRLWLLSRGAQPVGAGMVHPAGALIWGMGRVVAREYPGLRCTLIDGGLLADADEERALGEELWAGAGGLEEPQVALRGKERLVARLVRRVAGERRPSLAPVGTPFRVVAGHPGLLESLQLRELARRGPGPGEVEVQVRAAGLNFLDVMKALAIYPGLEASPEVALGAEAAGTVVAVGPGVLTPQIGDEVVLITPSYEATSCLSAFVTVPASFTAPRPPSLSAEQAAGLPVVYLTAYYALHELGRLRAGERVLIHAAAGGVGLAAVQICRWMGAEVLATAGSAEKRAYLRELGIEHVFDSRTLAFGEGVRAATGGRGVDLVLNSLAGEALTQSLALLAPRGRFIELGKRDIYANSQLGLAPFRRNLAFFALDLARLTLEEPDLVAGLLREVLDLVAAGTLPPLPIEVRPISAVAAAFEQMAQARHIGKLVLAVAEQPVTVQAAGRAWLRPEGSYLISGGMGALGLELAGWLVAQGVRNLALLGRGAPSVAAQAALGALEAQGARVLPLAADVADRAQLAAALARVRAELPPLRGVFHAAGVLVDATLAQMTPAQLQAALAPKVRGGWHLHTLTASDELDCFVLFSSVVALLGLAGQANYAAGNAWLDALAHARRAGGLPALSVNWGPWAEVGLAAAEAGRGARLAAQGLGSILPQEGLAALGRLLDEGLTQATVMRFDAPAWRASQGRQEALLVALGAAAPVEQGAGVDLHTALLALEPGRRRRELLEAAARAQLAQVLRIAPERIDRQRSLKSMGLDSLMALELRNRLEAATGLTLSATLAWNYPTITALAEHLAERMGLELEAPVAAEPEQTLSEPALEQLADAEVVSLLDDELAAIERLLSAE